MSEFLNLVISALFTSNLLLVGALAFGTNPKSFQNRHLAWQTGSSLTIVLVTLLPLSRLCHLLLVLWSLEHYSLLLNSLLAFCGTCSIGKILEKSTPNLWNVLEESFQELPFHGAILGTMIIAQQENYLYQEAFLFGLLSGLGVLLAQVSLVELVGHKDDPSPQETIQALPKIFLTAGLLSIAILGFFGLYFP